MATLWQDLRYAFRLLAKEPALATVAVLTLALGIGVNAAMFSVVDNVLLRPLPYAHADQLVEIYMRFTGIGIPKDQNAVSAPEYRDLTQLNHAFSDLAAVDTGGFNLAAQTGSEHVSGARVTPGLFSLLGTHAALGRVFVQEEGQPGHDSVVLLSNGLWKRKFGSDPSVIGRTVQVDSKPYTVVGVMPAAFDFPEESDIWTPLSFAPADLTPDNRGNHGLDAFARLKPGVSLAQARADMELVSRSIIDQNREYPYRDYNFKILLSPLLEETVGDVRQALWILLGAVGFVLLIACANIATLYLVRASARERETAIRIALGSSTGRLLRQWLTEGLLVGALGGAAGLFIAPWVLDALVHLAAKSVPRAETIRMTEPVVLFTIGISLLAGALIGLIPAFHSAHGVSPEALKEGNYTHAGGAKIAGTRRFLVAGEMALALVLLTGAGLLLRSFVRVLAVNPGFRADNVLTMRTSLPDAKYSTDDQARAFYATALERIRRIPGVVSAGAINVLPMSGNGQSGTIAVDTQAVRPEDRTPEADRRPVTPGLFETLGIPLLEGRYINDADTAASPRVVVVDETLAKTYWPHDDPLGERIKFGDMTSKNPWMTVVGVVGHVRYRTLEAHSRVTVYWPFAQDPYSRMSLVIRTQRDPMSFAPEVERQILSVDPEVPPYRVRSLDAMVAESVGQRKFAVVLISVFSGLALLLAALGIYGTIAYSVSQRYREIGIRMTLGAQQPDVLWMVLREGMLLAAKGIVAGLLGALIVTRLLGGLLFSVHATDPLTFLLVAAVLAAIALLACFLPALRATRVDPMSALRYE